MSTADSCTQSVRQQNESFYSAWLIEQFYQQALTSSFLGLGYHKDLQTRATFMEVLTKILQQGTEFDTLAETVLADRFERLVELVTMMGDQGELPIAMALANVVPGSHWVCTFPQYGVAFKDLS